MQTTSDRIESIEYVGADGGYAFYRLPDESSYHYVKGSILTAPDLFPEMESGGFVIAPFHADAQSPYVLLRPEIHECRPMPQTAEPAILSVAGPVAHRADYAECFALFHRALTEGRCQKAVMARCAELKVNGLDASAAVSLFHKACRLYPHSYIALWNTPVTGCWLMATPELLLHAEGERWKTMALAGTMPKDDPAAHRVETWSAKNREEQRIVADYIGGILHSLARNVECSPTRPTSAINVMHLRTDFSFALPAEVSPAALLRRLHPTPAVCGVPFEAARRVILQGEKHPRRYYSGFSGPFALEGETALYVSLRCMELQANRALLYAGGGLLADSIEEEEWTETERKMQTMLQLFNP